MRKFIAGDPMKPGDEQVLRAVVELGGRPELLDDAVAHHRQPVAEGHRLGLVVGDVDRGGVQPALDARDLGAHLDAQLGVEVGEGLVHEEGLGVAHDRAAHRHPLALAAGEVAGLALELIGDAQQVGGVLDLAADLLGGDLARRSAKPMFLATVMCG